MINFSLKVTIKKLIIIILNQPIWQNMIDDKSININKRRHFKEIIYINIAILYIKNSIR
jgi:hypothetical protein